MLHFKASLKKFEVIIHPSPSDHILGLSIGIRARDSLHSVCFGLTSWSASKYVFCSCSLRRTYSRFQWEGLPLLEGQDDEEYHCYQFYCLGSFQKWSSALGQG